ncbi:MAG: cell division protein CrgA, partial [Firmicutes bacterium]|nr:cell division protein CrgA [Bacillota bacterium]
MTVRAKAKSKLVHKDATVDTDTSYDSFDSSFGRKRPAKKSVNRTDGRYTAPIPKSVKRSPRWYPVVLLVLLFLGVLVIILNFVGSLPSSPTNWYTLVGLVLILVSVVMATRY